MSSDSSITLINLSEQLAFELDERLKKEICFGETLILSCGHHDGDVEDDSSESDWTCHESTSSESVSPVIVAKVNEAPPPQITDDNQKKEEVEEADFHFFFFPDCNKRLPPQGSKDSIVIIDGLPQINMNIKKIEPCLCSLDKLGECKCFIKIPCYCGAKGTDDCKCRELENMCVCKPLEPSPVCTCETDAQVCTCVSGIIQPECTCDKVEKPCVCRHDTFKFPTVVCTCKGKPGTISSSRSAVSLNEEVEYNVEGAVKPESKQRELCDCQKPDPKKLCYCKAGEECICKTKPCFCKVLPTCVCLPLDKAQCKDEPIENKNICACFKPKICTCGETLGQCTCFPAKDCTCGDPDNCKCFLVCDCKVVCVCDTQPETTEACECVDSTKVPASEIVCTCPKKESNKLKKVRAGKHGYRWCHEVDPRNTYFDYAYDRYDKIEQKESQFEKFVIQGLKGTQIEEDVSPIHDIKAPKYEKKVRRPCLDCCSAVGGMSISVEPLGEEKDKLLVQVVMHSSKEGAKTGSKLVSILDCSLHTMEENRTEFIMKNNLCKERRSYMALCDSGYYNKLTRICGEKYIVKRNYYTFKEARDFLLEGANIVFLRYIAITRFKGKIKTDAVMMDGHICQSIYVSHGVSQALVNATPMFVVKVERHIVEPTGYVHQTLTVLTLKGHVVSHEWADSNYVLHVNPLLKIIPTKDEIEEHAPLRKKWREDLQLLSDYLDFKTVRTSEGGRYMTESGALTGVVRDYLQAILLLRPQDTVCFTRHYFGSVLSALDLPHDEYFDSASRHVRYFFFEE